MIASDQFEEETNATLQAQEIEVLSSIYGSEWTIDSGSGRIYSIVISCQSKRTVTLQITLPLDYPIQSRPWYEMSAPWMSHTQKSLLYTELEEICCSHEGQCIIFLWIDQVRNFIRNLSNNKSEGVKNEILKKKSKHSEVTYTEELPSIQHGKPITDRQSVFQAHLAPVSSVDQVKSIINKLKENRKILSATHNIVAYRINAGGKMIKECDDDGERRGGSVLLYLLEISNVENIIVIVTRWYGGVHIGADRFKHITNCASDLLNQCGYIQTKVNIQTKEW